MANHFFLTKAQLNFFNVEILNERNGGDVPSTLDSAMGSLIQAPNDIVLEWCDDDEVMDTKDVLTFKESIDSLRMRYGSECELRTLIRDHRKSMLEMLALNPDQAWFDLICAFGGPTEVVADQATKLLQWLENGGALPLIATVRPSDDDTRYFLTRLCESLIPSDE